ncbi:MAG: type I methionyl aminopeptidase [Candidatus Marinimicrobia bacterium]|nr:type I methionyl aminopeptidase [Candidatus Neomarinimicrobiota bacterium]|tara:strand:- start:2192 stop:2935 length:744 start_codon:yes stop_codon:yes gene_type:complete
MIHLKNKNEIEKLYRAGQIVKETLFTVEEHIKPGISTLELDRIAEEFILSKNAIPGFKGLYGYPSTLCISVDDEVVHGLPSKRLLENGQLVSIDVGSIYDGFYGDHAKTFIVGQTTKEKQSLLKVTRECLEIGINQATVGNRIGDIGYSIQKHAESFGFGVVKELVGHGIGSKLHEDPQVPNFGFSNTGPKIEPGLCLAIEPMINLGSEEVFTKDDGWTVCTKDGKVSAHFEHSIAVCEDEIRVLTK